MRFFDIIIPSYNSDKLLTRCIESISDDVFKISNVIVVDDGSKVDQSKFIPKNKLNKIVFVKQNNSGPSGARNTGIKVCKNKYIIFVDSDDIIDSNKLLNLHKQLITLNIEPDLIRNGFIWKTQNKQKLISHKKPKLYTSKEKYLYKNFICNLYYWSSWTHIYKREFILRNNLFFKDGIIAEDLEHTIRSYRYLNTIFTSDIEYYIYDNTNVNSITYQSTKDLSENVVEIIKQNYGNKANDIALNDFINILYKWKEKYISKDNRFIKNINWKLMLIPFHCLRYKTGFVTSAYKLFIQALKSKRKDY